LLLIDKTKNYQPGNCRWATHYDGRMTQRRMQSVALVRAHRIGRI
jgi:hypothetical protein